MEELLNILKDLHPDVDFEKEERLVDDKILDSFDIISVISEIAEQFDVVISGKYFRRTFLMVPCQGHPVNLSVGGKWHLLQLPDMVWNHVSGKFIF